MLIYAIKISSLRNTSERLDGDFENISVQQPVTKISFAFYACCDKEIQHRNNICSTLKCEQIASVMLTSMVMTGTCNGSFTLPETDSDSDRIPVLYRNRGVGWSVQCEHVLTSTM